MAGKAAANLARIALNAGRLHVDDGKRDVVDIVTFIEADWGLNFKLWPVQRVILKAHYGIPLDDNSNNRFRITDWKRENEQWFTEAEYLRWKHDRDECNIAEVEPGHERRNLILPIGRRSGKCVVGDTLVFTDQGVVRIDSFDDFLSWVQYPGEEHFPLEITVAQEGARKRSKSAYFYRGGHREIRRVKTHCGYEIAGTPNHRVRVMTEEGVIDWRRLDEIRERDQIAVHRGTDLWASEQVSTTDVVERLLHPGRKNVQFPAHVDEKWGLLLGMLVGDGHWKPQNGICMTVEHDEMWELAEGLFEELLGPSTRTMDKRTENTGALRFHSVAAREFLHELGWDWDCDRYSKHVPWSIMKSPVPVVQAFLRGLFETDGDVESVGNTVSFSTASERLAREVQVLLLNLGIVSRRKAKWNKKHRRDYHVLTIRGLRSRTMFAERVGFMTRKKMAPLVAKIRSVSRERGDTEGVPHQRSWCRRLLDSVPTEHKSMGNGWQRSKLRDKLGNTIKLSAPDEMTYPRWREARPVALGQGASRDFIEHFDEIFSADYFYDPVEFVVEDHDEVYDLNVPEGESFVANGLTNHNTTISACISAYETYKLINKGNPQRYYGLAPSNPIRLLSVATGKDQAGLLYEEVSHHFAKCSFFKRYTANNTLSYARFQTPYDIEEFGSYVENPRARASVRVSFAACNAKSLRGPGNIVIILDEVAHFLEQGGSSAEEVYTALSPSNKTFTPKDAFGNPADGDDTESEGRIIMISSPLGKQGLFYDKFKQAMNGGDSTRNMLAVQAPTWEVNPTMSAAAFKEEYAFDPRKFQVEFGAEFTDRTLGWLDSDQDLWDCIDKNLRPRHRGEPRQAYFVGFDLGLVHDASSIAITHIDPQGRIILDFIGKMKAGEGEFIDKDRLEFEDVANWIYLLSRRFRFYKGLFDQWGAIPLEQALAKKGLTMLEGKLFSQTEKSQIWQNFKSLLWDRVGDTSRLSLYDITDQEKQAYLRREETPPEHLEYLEEIRSLQATYKAKYIIDVQAPQSDGKHDDMADALARSLYLASMHLGKLKHIAGSQTNADPNQPGVSAKVRRINHRKRLLGGSDPKRQVPRRRGR